MAFLIPGFVGLAGLAPLIPLVGEWLQPVNLGTRGIGPTVYALLAATAVGMILSCLRWLLIDQVLEWSGIRAPTINFRQLGSHLEAFDYLSDNHYRYYQFYANMLVAILVVYPIDRLLRTSPLLGSATDTGVILLCVVLFMGACDTLSKFRSRVSQLIGLIAEEGKVVMTNGIDHHGAGSNGRKERPDKTQSKPTPADKRHEAVAKDSQPRK